MPPERWYEEGVPRAEVGGDCRLQRLAKSREAPEIRVVQPHQAHRRAGRREVERSDVEIRDLLGREQRESPAAAYHAADVVPLIEVRRGRTRAGTRPEPPASGGRPRPPARGARVPAALQGAPRQTPRGESPRRRARGIRGWQ